MIKVIAPDANFLPAYMSGKWWDTQLIQTAATRQCFVKRISGGDSCIEFPDATLLPLTAFLGSAPDGFVIHNWPCFLSLTAAKYNDPVPEGIHDRIITDDEGVETVKTWAQWGSSAHVDLTNGTKGIPLVHNYTACTNVEAVTLYGLAGYTLLDTASYRALMPVSEGV
jgi:hypothetical protein